MSEKPLFQGVDEQEKVFAPQQLPRDGDETGEVAIAPVTGGSFVAGDAAPGPSATDAAPIVGAAALAKETEDDVDRTT